ncbi:MAG: pitrilysin family protein [Blastocatellia bacterium]|nr:pitrilysin family protein [Blastocatellia bacterium]
MESKAGSGNGAAGRSYDVRKAKLSNGVVVVTERMPHVRSISFGVFLGTGSRHEGPEQHGLTHFLEHAVFKGSRKRTAAQIAEETDALGGHLDAFTGREMVGFYNKVLDEHLPRAFELIGDLVTNPAFDAGELAKERNVILEEIKMVEDTPDDIIFDIFCETFYPEHPLGRTILGTPASLATFKGKRIRQYYDAIYCPENMVIAAAGNLEHERLLEMAEAQYGHLKPAGAVLKATTPTPQAPLLLRHKAELEQAHLVIGAPCPSLVSEDRYAAQILSVALGGGMSSRLFQSVREDLGLVYTIFASITPFKDCGYLNIYAGASTEQLEETIEATMSELEALKKELVSAEELNRNKDQLKASLMLALESTSSRMSGLAQQEMTFGRFITPDEVIARVEAVTAEDLHRLANEIFRPELFGVIVLGDLKGFTLDRSQLEC